MDKTRVWLEDIRLAMLDIDQFISDMDYESFAKDKKTRAAVERNLEIIGEAMDRILKVNPTIAITQARKIVDTRNKIIHNYEDTLPDIIWAIIKQHFPILSTEVTELLNKSE